MQLPALACVHLGPARLLSLPLYTGVMQPQVQPAVCHCFARAASSCSKVCSPDSCLPLITHDGNPVSPAAAQDGSILVPCHQVQCHSGPRSIWRMPS